MKWILGAATALLWLPTAAGAQRRPLLYDPVSLNIGINCQWQSRCMSGQHKAMKRALAYVAKARPAQWRVQMCNRNAGRSRSRVDWVGFNHCIQNVSLRPARYRLTKR
jgi:hypothetical protein